MGLRERLDRLESRAVGREAPGASPRSRAMERLLHLHENARREMHGLEPLADLPYTEEDRLDDRETLRETIPAYRMSPGYQGGEGKAFLDRWERETRQRLTEGQEHG